MDPLSISLAVITLATALKDIVETAGAIQDSFSKLPQNYRNAQKLAKEVLTTLRSMEEVYQEHELTFNKTKHLKKAISDLQIEIESAYEQCTRLVPPISEKTTEKIKIAFYSFRRRRKIERSLLEVKDHVDRCSQQFHLLSSFRTDALVIELHDALVQSAVHDPAGSPISGHSSLGYIANTHFFAFTQSTPMPMTRIADTTPTCDLSNAYLPREVGKVILSFQSTLTRLALNPPANMKILFDLSVSWSLQKAPVSNTIVHQEAVILAFRIQSLLRDSATNPDILSVDQEMNEITTNLDDLHMYEDAIALGTLRVDLWRMMTTLYPCHLESSSRGLAHALSMLGIVFSNMGNRNQACSATEEAIKAVRSLQPAHEPNMRLTNKLDIVLIARNLIRQAGNQPYSKASLQLALEGGRMLESILGLVDLRSGQPKMEASSMATWVVNSSSINIALKTQENSDDDWFTYACSLFSIAQIHRRSKESYKLAKLAVAILYHLLTKYPGSDNVQKQLATTLTYTLDLSVDTKDSRAILGCIEQTVSLLRRLAPINPQRHVLRLARTLWFQRKILLSLDRSVEAESVYQDLVSLKDLAGAPPHPDLQIPSETEAEYYAQIAEYHYEAKNFTSAVYTVQNAISQYIALESIDPSRSRAKHILAMALSCKSLGATQQYDAALSEGDKTMKMINEKDICGSDYHTVRSYGEVLCTMMEAAEASSHREVLKWAKDISSRVRKLACSGKLKFQDNLVKAAIRYIKLLRKYSRTVEADEYLLDLRDKWELWYT